MQRKTHDLVVGLQTPLQKMKKLYQFWPFNFGAIHQQNFQKAKIVILPVPYEGTVSFNKGTSGGPYAIIANSRYLDELWDGTGPNLIGLHSTDIFTLDEIEVSLNSPQEAIEGIRQAVEQEILTHKKIPFLLGGEHSISLGAVLALKDKYPDLSVVQLDAHADLFNEYEGTKYNHACVLRRIRELGIPAVQIGIRNINTEIERYLKNNKITDVYLAPKIPSIKKILKGLTKNIYLTIDLDVFDPGIMPSVGTPEPGGLGWYEVLGLIKGVAQNKNIVGADVVELAPIPGFNAPDFLAAKLVYKIISYIL